MENERLNSWLHIGAQPGTPAVSKDSMSTEMQYLHMQYPIDGIWHNESITGVPVTLTALDSNGNSENIGTVTTDGYYGTFSKTWTPPIEGDYKIIASFAGDDSYGSSSAATAISVGTAAATPTVTSAPVQSAPDTTPLMAATFGIIIAIAVATALILLTLRRRS